MRASRPTAVRGDVLVTGATGFVGRFVCLELLRRGERVFAVVREDVSSPRVAAHRAWIEARLGAPAPKLTYVFGDLGCEALGLTEADREQLVRVDRVLHLGASMAMGLSASAAFEVNVRGSERVVALAASLPSRPRLVFCSGFRTASIAPSEAVGAYETSKVLAHRRVDALCAELGVPLTLVEPATVIGDSVRGETTVFWGFASLVRDVALGRLDAVPGGTRAWMPLVTVDYLASFLADVPVHDARAGTMRTEYVVLDDATPSMRGLVDAIAEHLGVRAPRFDVPVSLARAAMTVAGRHDEAEMLAFVGPERFDVRSADAEAERAGLRKPAIDAAIRRAVDFLVATRFGADLAVEGGLEVLGGERVFVRRRAASGPTVLAFHGLPQDGASFEPLVTALGQGSFVVPDLPGAGRSPRAALGGAGDAGALGDAAWARATARALPRGGQVVIGHSYGAGLALDAAEASPEVALVVLLAPRFAMRRGPALHRCRHATRVALALRGRSLLRASLPSKASSTRPSYADELEPWWTRPGALAVLAARLAEADAQRDARRAQLARMRAPIVIVHGADEPLEFAPPGARVHVVGAGHSPHLERPEEVARILEDALVDVLGATPQDVLQPRFIRQPPPG